MEKLTEKLRPLREYSGVLDICRQTEHLLIHLALSYLPFFLYLCLSLLLPHSRCLCSS